MSRRPRLLRSNALYVVIDLDLIDSDDELMNNLFSESLEQTRKRPANPDLIDKNNVVDCEDYVCTICQEKLKQGSVCWKIKLCEHSFHSECLKPWTESNNTCPVCRIKLKKKRRVKRRKTSSGPTLNVFDRLYHDAKTRQVNKWLLNIVADMTD